MVTKWLPMRAALPYRIAAVLLLLFFAGHTWGAMIRQPGFGVASDGVLALMKNVSFSANGTTCTWYGWWAGFGWMVSVFFLFSALVAWRLATRPDSTLGWALCAACCINFYLSLKWFFAPPAVFSALIAVCLAWGELLRLRSPKAS
jgi:hypothetical protein